MGEWLKQVPVKLTRETIEAIDGIIASQPFQVGRSTVARGIIERFLSLMACGIVTFAADLDNRVLSNSSRQGIPADSKEVVSDNTPRMPLARKSKPPAGGRHYRFSRLSAGLGGAEEKAAFRPLPFRAMFHPFFAHSSRGAL